MGSLRLIFKKSKIYEFCKHATRVSGLFVEERLSASVGYCQRQSGVGANGDAGDRLCLPAEDGGKYYG